ncbi:MAG: hypothetical protein VX083_00320 [Pseudomonadota bacterium]|nr:hypothetical protein [Pseudomonadota bacterium]
MPGGAIFPWLKRRWRLASGVALAGLAALTGATVLRAPASLTPQEIDTLYSVPLPAPDEPMQVFHLGHSLVGRDMPVMLQQLVTAHFGAGGKAAQHHSQLGWGTPLRAHWDPSEPINGFDTENDHANYRDAKAALATGDYDAVVLTEMVEIRDAIAYFETADYLARWAEAARAGNPAVRVYLYETWHEVTDPEGWVTRLDRDLTRYWQDQILWPAVAQDPDRQPIYLIPAGQVMAAFTRRVEAAGGVTDVTDRQSLFQRSESGELDPIHINDLGAYLVALTHFAVLYQHSPVGLPHQLTRADGSDMQTIAAETAALMQETVWSVVSGQPHSGFSAK